MQLGIWDFCCAPLNPYLLIPRQCKNIELTILYQVFCSIVLTVCILMALSKPLMTHIQPRDRKTVQQNKGIST